MIFLTMLFLAVGFLSCSPMELEVREDFPFEVSVMPVTPTLHTGQTVELRLRIHPAGTFIETSYYIRYFQYDGTGILRYGTGEPYLPNDLYLLPEKEFRLYYTSHSTGRQTITVWVSDNFGNEKQLHFRFDSPTS